MSSTFSPICQSGTQNVVPRLRIVASMLLVCMLSVKQAEWLERSPSVLERTISSRTLSQASTREEQKALLFRNELDQTDVSSTNDLPIYGIVASTVTQARIDTSSASSAVVDRSNATLAGDDASQLQRYASSCKHRDTPPRLVTIRGERHSGTNLVRLLIDYNSVNLLKRNDTVRRTLVRETLRKDSLIPYEFQSTSGGLYGWKHGFLRHEHPNDQIEPSDVLLVVTRDVFSWLISMFQQPYNFKMTAGMEHFDAFMRGEYVAKCEFHEYYHGCQNSMEGAPNLIQLRTAKYKNWLMHRHGSRFDGNEANCTWDVIRYESLTETETSMESTILSFFDRQRIDYDRNATFRSIKGRVTWSKVPSERAYEVKAREYYLSQYTTEQLQFVLDTLDLDFEKHVLNYTYDYVKAYIKDREIGVVNASYSGPPVLTQKAEQARKELIELYQRAESQRPRTKVQVVRRVANSSQVVRVMAAERKIKIGRSD